MNSTSDLFFEGRILAIRNSDDGKTGWVDFHGARVLVNLSLVPGIQVGDKVAVQGRIAVSRVEEDYEICG